MDPQDHPRRRQHGLGDGLCARLPPRGPSVRDSRHARQQGRGVGPEQDRRPSRAHGARVEARRRVQPRRRVTRHRHGEVLPPAHRGYEHRGHDRGRQARRVGSRRAQRVRLRRLRPHGHGARLFPQGERAGGGERRFGAVVLRVGQDDGRGARLRGSLHGETHGRALLLRATRGVPDRHERGG